MHVLAPDLSAAATGGAGEHEPILMTLPFRTRRVFHAALGYDDNAMKGLAFQFALQRGVELAAAETVKQLDLSGTRLTSVIPAMRDPADVILDEVAAIPDVCAKGRVPLFNGKDQSGWSQKNGTATYRFEKQMIVGKIT